MLVAACTVTLCHFSVVSAAEPPAPVDARRMTIRNPEFLEQYGATRRFANGRPSGIQITRAGDAVLYLRSGPRSFEQNLLELDSKTGRERVLATAARLLGEGRENITAEEQARRERQRQSARGITAFDISRDGRTVLIPLSGKLFLVDRTTGMPRKLPEMAEPPLDPQLSPDGSKVAYVRGGDLYVMQIADGSEQRVTTGA